VAYLVNPVASVEAATCVTAGVAIIVASASGVTIAAVVEGAASAATAASC
jgi:hypothetical protein